MLIRPDHTTILMNEAGPEGGGGGNSSPASTDAPTQPGPGAIDWRQRYEALEVTHRETSGRLTELEQASQEAARAAAGDDMKQQLELRDTKISDLEAKVGGFETQRRHDSFMRAATKGAPEDKRGQLELMIKGELAANKALGEGDLDIAADKLRRSFQERGFGALFEVPKPEPEPEGKPKPGTPSVTTPAKGKRDWSKVTTLAEVPADQYSQIPDEHWVRLTGQ